MSYLRYVLKMASQDFKKQKNRNPSKKIFFYFLFCIGLIRCENHEKVIENFLGV